MVEADLEKLQKLFSAEIAWKPILELYTQRKQGTKDTRIIKAVDDAMKDLGSPESKRASQLSENYHKQQEEELSSKKTRRRSPSEQARVYVNDHAPLVVSAESKNWIALYRYRVRPAGSEREVPSKYNLFNARLDSLQKRRTWRSLLMRRHGILSIKGFYEWVLNQDTQQKQVVYFQREDSHLAFVPCLFDLCLDGASGRLIRSFALITGDPPAEVEAAGHDRCPIVLPFQQAHTWLNPRGHTVGKILAMLEHAKSPKWTHAPAST